MKAKNVQNRPGGWDFEFYNQMSTALNGWGRMTGEEMYRRAEHVYRERNVEFPANIVEILEAWFVDSTSGLKELFATKVAKGLDGSFAHR